MSINQEFVNRRRPIIPSARRSIHPQEHRVANGVDMTRYGDESSDEERPALSDAGFDEVDNVQSKLTYGSTPINMRRRTSLSPPNLQYTDDSEEQGALAKSLPATLSPSNYSDDFDSWRLLSACSNNTSDSSPRSRGNKSGDSRNSSFANRSPSVSHRINQSRSPNVSHRINQSRSPNVSHRINQSSREHEKLSGTIFKYILGLLALLCAVYYHYFFSSPLGHPQTRYDEERFHSDLNELGAKYKVDDNSILQLQAGISTIFKKEDTSCVIFLYNSQKNDFDPSIFDGFVNNVVSNSAKFLRNDTSPGEHRIVEGADLDMRSHTQLVQAYQDDIAKAGVLLVRDVARVPSPLAMAFHYYCDEYQPLVRKSAIFFTLNTAKCHNSGEKSSHASVEKCLKEKWNTVPKDNIGPLLTRVVSIVVDVTSGV